MNSDPIPAFRIEIWTDLGCPWCYLGKHRLQTAIDDSGHADDVELVVRSCELDPHASTEPVSISDFLTKKRGVSSDDVHQMENHIRDLAQAEDLPFGIDRLNANTLDIHRVTHLAASRGKGVEFFDRLQREHFTGGSNPFLPDTIVKVAVDVGIAEQEVRGVLDSDRYTADVRADEEEARGLGVTGVPFVVLDRRYGIPGAQSLDVYRDAIRKAYREPAGTTPQE